eukprot:TRINITY_DN3271_c0_g2_i1.p1 TRINITY_DN3271_c0_g2~~TRINITY_DN3271_c0_g2_i1.p1  ORF type:complete len:288 (-),score=47.74 TRINITY_DN3271_c0_g2_i1:260-1123(-)
MGNRVCTALAVNRPLLPLPEDDEAVAVITGGGSGIGRALALRLASAGHLVVIVGRRADILEDVANEALGRIFPCPADVSTAKGRETVVAFVGQRPVSVLVHNAAVCKFGCLSDMSLEAFQQEQRVNLEAPVFLTQCLMPNMSSHDFKARVLMVSSGAADMVIPTMGSYCMTKAAMKIGWKSLRDELKDKVCIGYCIPGLVSTEITENQIKDPSFALKDIIASRVEAGDIHSSKEVGEWMATLLDRKICDDDTFVQREHNIDDVAHQYGLSITLTTEGKLNQQASQQA